MTGVVIPHLIGGDWVLAAELRERYSPAHPDELVSAAANGDITDVNRAITAAAEAACAWRDTPEPTRGAVLMRAAELLERRAAEISRELCSEEGKTLAEATGEVARATAILRFFGALGWQRSGEVLPSTAPRTHLYTRREPIGVVALITPWNFPIAIPAWKLAPALVSGNTAVLKPAELTPLAAHRLAEALVDAGVPPGVVNVVHGAGELVGDALIRDLRVGAISFTGSGAVGRTIHAVASERMARVQVEMGGKNAVVVLDDADPQMAAGIIAAGGFGLTGQACTATSRVIATPRIIDELTAAVAIEARRWAPGDGLDPDVRMGPVVSEEQLATNLDHIAAALEGGAELLFGGTHAGQLMEPAAFRGVTPEMTIAREEVFGPVLAIMAADDIEDAIELTNASPFGLAAGIVTNDLAAAMRFADRVEAGVIKVNRATTGLDLNAPFGGLKESSSGTWREQGAAAVDFYTRTKTVYLGT
jgi:alpha-ketoglutaric semialdehyde dehydrogenase